MNMLPFDFEKMTTPPSQQQHCSNIYIKRTNNRRNVSLSFFFFAEYLSEKSVRITYTPNRPVCTRTYTTNMLWHYRGDNTVLTDDGAVAEEQLMELRGETGEETSERRDEAAHDGRQSRGFAPAKRYRHRRQQQRHSRGHCSQPSCAHKRTR